MAIRQLGNETTTVYADGAEFVMERVFDAPRALVWKALTEPERVARWWSPTMTVEEMDVRQGGRWRWIAHNPDGEDAPFKGEYLEVVPPERLVFTEFYDVEPFNAEPAVTTMLLEDLGGRTKLTSRSRFPSIESLEGALATGMVGGAIQSWDRLAEEVGRA